MTWCPHTSANYHFFDRNKEKEHFTMMLGTHHFTPALSSSYHQQTPRHGHDATHWLCPRPTERPGPAGAGPNGEQASTLPGGSDERPITRAHIAAIIRLRSFRPAKRPARDTERRFVEGKELKNHTSWHHHKDGKKKQRSFCCFLKGPCLSQANEEGPGWRSSWETWTFWAISTRFCGIVRGAFLRHANL